MLITCYIFIFNIIFNIFERTDDITICRQRCMNLTTTASKLCVVGNMTALYNPKKYYDKIKV